MVKTAKLDRFVVDHCRYVQIDFPHVAISFLSVSIDGCLRRLAR